MMTAQEYAYLRARALRVVNDDSGAYPLITHTLAVGLLDLLDLRARGQALAEDRLDAELAEVRDGIATLAAATVAMPVYRRERQEDRRQLDELRALLGLVEQRVNGIARRVDALDAVSAQERQHRER